MNVLKSYVNGDYIFTIYSDGTLIRETNVENPKVVHPSSIDVKITDYCDMGCNFCFTPDMMVLTEYGNIVISNIKIGDKVYTLNIDKNIVELKEVYNIIVKKHNEIIYLFELENGNIIKCTSEHELFTINRGWVKAKNILETDELNHISISLK